MCFLILILMYYFFFTIIVCCDATAVLNTGLKNQLKGIFLKYF